MPLASSATLCRFENRADRSMAVQMHEVLLDQFIASFKRAPRRLILDFDATDDAVHGDQEQRFFHGYYDQYCFLPLYVFCGRQLLVSYLRPIRIDARETCLGDSCRYAGEANSSGISDVPGSYLPRRLGLLSLAHAQVVRTS